MLALTKNIVKTYRTFSRRLPTFGSPKLFAFNNSKLTMSCRSFFCTNKQDLKDSEQTFQLLLRHLKEKVDHATELEQLLIDESSKQNTNLNKEQVRIQISQMTPLIELYQNITAQKQNAADLEQMLKQTKDEDEKAILNEELKSCKERIEEARQQCWELLVPPAPYDKADDIILQFRPGAGGSESCIFIQNLSQMYEAFASMQGWRVSVSNSSKEVGVSKGYKLLDLRVQGHNCHKMMKCESGVHKVIRVPETEAKGRLHSSTISMVVMPVVPFTFEVDPKEIKYQFTRSSGPGGQGVNKVESACRAIHIPTGIAVFIQEERSQDTNKKRATQILKQKVFQIEYKKAMDEESSKRKSQVTTLDRSQKIRTYNYPQDRITDHRTGLTKFGIQSMMEGQMLEEFIETYMESIREEKITALVNELYERAGITPPR